MSLVRNSSRKKFAISTEDLASCLDQKNSMIAVLQAEVQDLRFNQEKYDRLQTEVCRAKEKYENLLIDTQITKYSNQERLQLTAKNCVELKIQVDHLDKQVQIKSQILRDGKAQSQQLAEHSNRRQDDVTEIEIRGEQLRATNQLLKMEQQRNSGQITLARQELQRQRRENANVNKSLETVKDKCHKTQSYMRSLMRQEAILNETLAKTEDENNYLDAHISELNSVNSIATADCANLQKQIQDNKFYISSKELEFKRIQKQIKEAIKTWAMQKEKLKSLTEQCDQKKFSLNRMQGDIRECSEEINYILNKNNQINEVNSQLKNDLKVCERHLQNVMRINKNVDSELNKFRDLNLMAMKKLQQPMRDVSNSTHPVVEMTRNSATKWNNISRMTATGGLDCSL